MYILQILLNYVFEKYKYKFKSTLHLLRAESLFTTIVAMGWYEKFDFIFNQRIRLHLQH